MIYVTGDLHGANSIYRLDLFREQAGANLTRDDYVIILGDFGMIFSSDTQFGYYFERLRLVEYFEEKYPWTTLFIDGNHENFVHLKKFPKRKWNGTEASFLTDHCIWLRRGNIYTIEDKTFLTIGGAYSIDKSLRQPLISWWKDEDITHYDIRKAKRSLAQHNNSVDYVLTHCAPLPIFNEIAEEEGFVVENSSKNETLLQKIDDLIDFKTWYFGHYHINRSFRDGKYRCLYQDIEKII